MWAILREPCDENIIRSQSAEAPCSKPRGRWILAATILASGMAFIDGTVVNVAYFFDWRLGFCDGVGRMRLRR